MTATCRCGHAVTVSPATAVYAWDYERGRLVDEPTYAHPGCLAPADAELRRKHGAGAVRPKGTPRPGAARLRHRKSPRTA